MSKRQGSKYLVEETVIPDGYTNVPEKLIIDLAGVEEVTAETEARSVVIKNKPDPVSYTHLDVYKRQV